MHFRALNSEQTEYVYGDGIRINANGIYLIDIDGDGGDLHVKSIDDIEETTGIKDVNGNAIFEGDVILDLYSEESGEVVKQKSGAFSVYFGNARPKPMISDIICMVIGGRKLIKSRYAKVVEEKVRKGQENV